MKHIINAKNTTVTEGIKTYVENKFNKFDKYVHDDVTVYTKIEVKDNGNRHKVEVTIPIGKDTLRTEVNDKDMYAAIDDAEKTMARMLRKRKEKRIDKKREGVELVAAEEEIVVKETADYDITRVKNHKLSTMSTLEACEAMEMVGHSFYVYKDTEKDSAVCAVYVRKDGTYGHLIFE
jgi:putative sigma-54 modulation protein